MRTGQPSHTAFRAAAHRAAHQTLEGGRIFADPLAEAVLGTPPLAVFGETIDKPQTRAMRRFIAARSRFAEDSLAAAVERGVRQYVVLGAGLDTFAHRNRFADIGLQVFEVDHPATQGWKRRRLAEAGLVPPASLVFAPTDFERETLDEGLARAGFDRRAGSFFAWLGVIVYLTREAVEATLRFVAALPGGAEIVFDYGEPVGAYSPERRSYEAARAQRLAELGEPWLSRFTPAQLADLANGCGFAVVEDLGPSQIARRFQGEDRPDEPGGHLVRAAHLDRAR
ncbi:MAG: class I SAM-dependent methyltransferase [Caulobacteraceae bacterium]